MLTQQDYNIKIAEFILAKCKGEDGKNLRFQQLLFNLNITEFSDEVKKFIKEPNHPVVPTSLRDKYNEPSEVTYHNLTHKFKEDQTKLFDEIVSQTGINIVTCGNCGETLLHEVGDTEIFCGYCDRNMALSDCPDLKY